MNSTAYAPVLCKVDYRMADQDQCRVTGYRGARLGRIDVCRYEGVGIHRGDRRPDHIESDWLHDYLVTIPVRARIEFAQAGHSGFAEPGAFVLLSTSKPFAASVSSLCERDIFSAMHIRIPGNALRQRMPYVDECCDLPIRLRPGAGVIMQKMCELAVDEGNALSLGQAAQFGATLVDAVVNATAESPEVLAMLAEVQASCSTYTRILRQARAYIEANLSDPTLDTERVAAHCHVSKRYLQAVFAESGHTVNSTIREMRLQRCRTALRSHALHRQSVAHLAMHWGFSDLPYFCRVYKARFGQSPGQDRSHTRSLQDNP
jgi:AraC-like DNA-binding protein